MPGKQLSKETRNKIETFYSAAAALRACLSDSKFGDPALCSSVPPSEWHKLNSLHWTLFFFRNAYDELVSEKTRLLSRREVDKA